MLDEARVPDPRPGQTLVKARFLSVDPCENFGKQLVRIR